MTYAPSSIVAAAQYLVGHGFANGGIVGDAAHQATRTSYHLGKSALKPGAYSAILPRDVAGLTEAASALDISGGEMGLPALRTLSVWMAQAAKDGRPGTEDWREVIYSPDGTTVLRWDNATRRQYTGGDGTGQGDNSHRWHTHLSWYRDSEHRDKVGAFRAYFEEVDVIVGKGAGQWLGTVKIKGTGHYLVATNDLRKRYGPRPDGEVLTVLAALDLPTDVDGKTPPVGTRNQVYLVDKPEFGAAAFALREDCTALADTPYLAGYNAARTKAAKAVSEI